MSTLPTPAGRLRASEIHADGTRRIIAIERVEFSPRRLGDLYQLSARIEPAALVVCEAGDRRVVGLALADASLETLERDVDGLRAMLAKTPA